MKTGRPQVNILQGQNVGTKMKKIYMIISTQKKQYSNGHKQNIKALSM